MKRILSLFMAFMLVVTAFEGVNVTDTKVLAATNPGAFSDNYIVDFNVIPDTELLKAIKNIIGGGKDITFSQLKSYTGEIDLSNYTLIEDVAGLGYAMKASSVDLSKLIKVKKIEQNEFETCTFSSFKLPEYIQEIGTSAFNHCENLETIVFPETLSKIHAQAFLGCVKLNNITFPTNISKIGNEAFSGCISIESIVIPDNINATIENSSDESANGLGTNIFSGCSSITSVKLGAGMTAIPAGFLQKTTRLYSIDVPERITSIRSNAFSGSGIISIDLSKNTKMTKVSSHCFDDCENLSRVKLPDSIEIIENSAFANCIMEDYISKPEDKVFVFDNLNKLKIIEDNAFAYCYFEKLNLPGNIEKIGAAAFKSCRLLKSITLNDFTYEITDDVVLSIGDSAFSDCSALETINFPTGNEDKENFKIEINKQAFYKDVSLKNINLSKNVTKIGDEAFKECGESVKIYDEVASLGGKIEPQYIYKEYAEGLTEVEMYSTEIPEYNIIKTAYINLNEVKPESDKDPNLVTIYYKDDNSNTKRKFYTQVISGLEEVDLSRYTNIEFGKDVFSKCINLNKVTLPQDMETVPEGMFKDCAVEKISTSGSTIKSFKNFDGDWYKGINEVVMSDNIKTIGISAFENCYMLNINNDLPSDLVKIDNRAFYNCQNIGKIEFPSQVEYIGKDAFANCGRVVDNILCSYKGLTGCDVRALSNLKFIGSGAFTACPFDTFLMNREGKTKIVYGGTFNNCQYLKTARLSNEVEAVLDNSFSRCLRIDSIEIPDKCTLAQKMFYGDVVVSSTAKYFNDIKECYDYKRVNQNLYYIPYAFTISVNVVEKEQAVRVNEAMMLPFLATPSSVNCSFKEMKIGDNSFVLDGTTGEIEGSSEQCVMAPIVNNSYKHLIEKTDFTAATSINTIATGLFGKTSAENVPVIVETEVTFVIYTGDEPEDDLAGMYSCALSAQYTVDVQENTCKEIANVKDNYYVNKTNTTTQKIEPDFIPTYDDSDVTDNIEWKIDTGSEYITLNVAEDGRSATVASTKLNVGTSKITITAGTVQKSFYVRNVVPASSISIDKTNCNVMLNAKETLSATMSYSADNEVYKDDYPDFIEYTSADESIVKVEKTKIEDGKTICTLVAVGLGTTKVTAKASASGRTASCNVSVSSENLKINLTDSENNPINASDNIKIVKTAGLTINYDFNEILSDYNIETVIENPTVAKVVVNSSRKYVTISGLKKGTTKITLYPKMGNAQQNGITINVQIDPDITSIVLKSKTIELNSTDNVFSVMKNAYGTQTTVASEDEFKNITSNDIVFESSDENIATVDSIGNVTIRNLPSDGQKVTITCKAIRDGEVIKQASATVTPQAPSIKSVNILGVKNISVGEKITLDIQILPELAKYQSIEVNGSYKYDQYVKVSVDVVNKKINIEGISKGKVTLTVRVKDQSAKYITQNFEIGISEKSESTTNASSDKVKKVTKLKAKKGVKKVTLSWKKIGKVSGYQIQMSMKKKGGFKTIKTFSKANKVKYIKKKLKSKKRYYFRVRAFVKKANGKKVYGKWSLVRSTKIK